MKAISIKTFPLLRILNKSLLVLSTLIFFSGCEGSNSGGGGDDSTVYTLSITSHQNEARESIDSTIGFTVGVSPTNNSSGDITITVNFSGTATIADFTEKDFPETLTIPNGENTADIIILSIHDDSEKEGLEQLTVEVSITNVINDYAYSSDKKSATVNIIDKEDLPYIIGFASLHPKILDINWNPVEAADSYTINENRDGSSGFSLVTTTVNTTESIPVSLIGPNRVSTNTQYLIEATLKDQTTKQSSEKYLTQENITQLIGRIRANNSNVFDDFGGIVALSGDGKTLAVGARYESSNAKGVGGDETNDSAAKAGAVYVFTSDNDWQQTAYIKASNTDEEDRFGTSIALSNDGKTLAVGVPLEDSNATGTYSIQHQNNNVAQNNNTASRSGAVYLFVLDSSWTQTAYIKASNTKSGDNFGESVALSGDGKTLVVGTPKEESDTTGTNSLYKNNDLAPNSGAVYVFTSDNDWQQTAYIKASNTGENDLFGNSIALSNDGKTLAVGAKQEGSNSTGTNGNQRSDSENTRSSGAVYLFTLEESSWTQTAYIKASNTGQSDNFGESVALSGDGKTLAVGVPQEDSTATGVSVNWNDDDNNNSTHTGAVYVFTSDNDWQQTTYIKASDTDEYDKFGSSVALSADGKTLAVGAALEGNDAIGIDQYEKNNKDAQNSGAMYLFTLDSSWTKTHYIKANTQIDGGFFGTSVSLSSNGTTLAVGANGFSGAAVYLY